MCKNHWTNGWPPQPMGPALTTLLGNKYNRFLEHSTEEPVDCESNRKNTPTPAPLALKLTLWWFGAPAAERHTTAVDKGEKLAVQTDQGKFPGRSLGNSKN